MHAWMHGCVHACIHACKLGWMGGCMDEMDDRMMHACMRLGWDGMGWDEVGWPFHYVRVCVRGCVLVCVRARARVRAWSGLLWAWRWLSAQVLPCACVCACGQRKAGGPRACIGYDRIRRNRWCRGTPYMIGGAYGQRDRACGRGQARQARTKTTAHEDWSRSTPCPTSLMYRIEKTISLFLLRW